jgi:hypothetical protein
MRPGIGINDSVSLGAIVAILVPLWMHSKSGPEFDMVRLCWLSHKFVGNSLDMPSLKLRKIGTLPL